MLFASAGLSNEAQRRSFQMLRLEMYCSRERISRALRFMVRRSLVGATRPVFPARTVNVQRRKVWGALPRRGCG